MPVSSPKQVEPDADGVDEPEWKRQSVERSLKAARVRAQQRSDRFVAATIELMDEKGSTDFTVQDVVDRSKMSIRTFYNFFASKDDLFVAVYETVLVNEVAPRLRHQCDKQPDPVLKIRAYIDGLYDLTVRPGPASRALTTEHNRLAETRPSDLERAFKPHIDLLVELIHGAVEAKKLRPTLPPEKLAKLIHHTSLSIIHARILGPDEGSGLTADELWTFCAHGIGVSSPR